MTESLTSFPLWFPSLAPIIEIINLSKALRPHKEWKIDIDSKFKAFGPQFHRKIRYQHVLRVDAMRSVLSRPEVFSARYFFASNNLVIYIII